MDWITVKTTKESAESLAEKQGITCICGKKLIYRDNFEFWCEDLRCMALFVLDQDGHIFRNGRVSKSRETRCLL